jgi:membrane-associated phospholipid phosphatase
LNLYKTTFIILTFVTPFSICSDAYASDSLQTHERRSPQRDKTVWQKIGNDIVLTLNDAGNYFTSPLRFSGKDWLYIAGFAGVEGVIMATDKEMKNRLGRNTTSSINHDFWDIPTDYGNALYVGALCGAFYATGLFTSNDWIRVTGRMLLEGLAFAGTVDITVKYIAGRQRPYTTDNQWNFLWFQTNNDFQSFPSGHSPVAFVVSTVLAERIDNNLVRAGLYGFAGLTALARVVNNQHWLSDVVAGSLLGFCTGYFVVHREDQREHGTKGGTGLSFYPSLSGFHAVYNF